MMEFFEDYYWKEGKPRGIKKKQPNDGYAYKIVADPYYKRISIEKYASGLFENIIYDSFFLDFRHLKERLQPSWQRETMHEKENQIESVIRNQDDRLILREQSFFVNHRCVECQIFSIHGNLISTHKMSYKALKDPFDGVILYDANERPVMRKEYEVDPITGDFTTLILEEWDMQHLTTESQNPVVNKFT